jgi:hypothetical protein
VIIAAPCRGYPPRTPVVVWACTGWWPTQAKCLPVIPVVVIVVGDARGWIAPSLTLPLLSSGRRRGTPYRSPRRRRRRLGCAGLSGGGVPYVAAPRRRRGSTVLTAAMECPPLQPPSSSSSRLRGVDDSSGVPTPHRGVVGGSGVPSRRSSLCRGLLQGYAGPYGKWSCRRHCRKALGRTQRVGM